MQLFKMFIDLSWSVSSCLIQIPFCVTLECYTYISINTYVVSSSVSTFATNILIVIVFTHLRQSFRVKQNIFARSILLVLGDITTIVQLQPLSWWRHQLETFSALLALCAGNSPVTGEFPSQRPVTRSFDVFFDLCPNKRLSKQSWGWWFETPSRPLWRYCNVASP